MTIKETPVTEIKKTYVADDGTEFKHEYDCKKYEARKNTLPPSLPQIEYFTEYTDAKCWFYITSYDDLCNIGRYFEEITSDYLDTDGGTIDFVSYPDWIGFWLTSTLDGKQLQGVSFKSIENDYLELKRVLHTIPKGEK